jgi:potassium-dependent mechanosensitive channel
VLYTLKQYRIVFTYPLYRPANLKVIRVYLSLLMLLLLAPASASPASALLKGIMPDSSSNPVPGQSTFDPAALTVDIKQKLAATKAELAFVPSEAAGGTSTGLSGAEVDIFARRFHLRQLVFLYQGQLARLSSLQIRQQRRLELENQAANWSGFSETSSHPFLRADELKESLTSLSSQLDELEAWIPSIDQTGIQVVTVAENSTVKLRQADEAIELAKKSPDEQARLSRERDLLALQNRIDLARAMGFQIERQAVQEELLESQAMLQLANKQLSLASEHAELTQQDLDQVQKNIEIESQHIIAELKQGVSALDLEKKTAQQEGPASNVTLEAAQPQFTDPDQIDQLRLTQQITTDIKLQVLNRILVYLQMQRDIWNLRWAFAKVTDREKAGEAYDRIAGNQAVLKTIHDYINHQRHRVLELVTSQSVKELDPDVSSSNAFRDALRNLDQVVSYSRLLGAIESTQNLLERCKQELDDRFRVKSFSDYREEALLMARDIASQVWGVELFEVQDNIEVDGQIISGKRSVTVDKVVTVLAILIVGYWFAVRLARLIEGHSVTRLGIDASLARIARRWILFLEVVFLVVLSMLVVKIPLTIFAFMGGALAIGACFGMQNMLKNLISGLMLLFERPFRPGDVVEVGGIRGRVTDIGVRSSHIIDGNGIETVIPNSTFIEQNVTNWTLSSKSVRIVVNIGIAYGSPVKEVKRLLLEVADQHGLVLDEPVPQVLLEDFANDALLFGLYIWVEIKPEVSWKTIASDLRYMINKTLTEHDIVISFPQRDIHLDTCRPLEIRVLADAPDIGSVKG